MEEDARSTLRSRAELQRTGDLGGAREPARPDALFRMGNALKLLRRDMAERVTGSARKRTVFSRSRVETGFPQTFFCTPPRKFFFFKNTKDRQ